MTKPRTRLSAEDKKPHWFLRVSSGDKHYLVMSEGKLLAFKTCEEACGYFERSYANAHHRSYESSMSACLNFIMFEPEAVGPLRRADLVRACTETPHAFSLWTIAGGVDGMLIQKPLKCKAVSINVAAGLAP